jgi:hypothetical protein
MEPKLPSPDRGSELHSADTARNGEMAPQSFSPETEAGQSVERRGRQVETAVPAETVHVPPVALPVPTVSSASTDDAIATLPQVQDDTPATANDNELIEKEWVDKAKKVIAETKDDPYRREQEVSRLQADYLLKRYGRKLGSPQ